MTKSTKIVVANFEPDLAFIGSEPIKPSTFDTTEYDLADITPEGVDAYCLANGWIKKRGWSSSTCLLQKASQISNATIEIAFPTSINTPNWVEHLRSLVGVIAFDVSSFPRHPNYKLAIESLIEASKRISVEIEKSVTPIFKDVAFDPTVFGIPTSLTVEPPVGFTVHTILPSYASMENGDDFSAYGELGEMEVRAIPSILAGSCAGCCVYGKPICRDSETPPCETGEIGEKVDIIFLEVDVVNEETDEKLLFRKE